MRQIFETVRQVRDALGDIGGSRPATHGAVTAFRRYSAMCWIVGLLVAVALAYGFRESLGIMDWLAVPYRD